MGLAAHASLLVNQTMLGAAALLMQSHEQPAALRAKVTSPGGTTEAACRHLDTHHVRDRIVEAVQAAMQRSVELGVES
jgi:pyrroline-5-carboxylate reductase